MKIIIKVAWAKAGIDGFKWSREINKLKVFVLFCAWCVIATWWICCNKLCKLYLYFYSRTPLIRPPSESHWCGRIRPCSHLFRFAFRSRSSPVPLVRVAFTPGKIDWNGSGFGPVARSHLFRNATGTSSPVNTPTHPPPQHTRFLG